MYEMEEASSAPPHQGSQSPGQLALGAARRGQAPVRKSSFPVSLTSRSFPQMVPVSGGESISTPSASAAQDPFPSYFRFFLRPQYIHRSQAVFRS
jgi:hypothetical protein